jgi:hypothetical protein
LATKKSRTLQILAFDEKSTFDFFVLYNNCLKIRGNLRKFTETRARAPRARRALNSARPRMGVKRPGRLQILSARA